MKCHYCYEHRGLTAELIEDPCPFCPTCARIFPRSPSYLPSGMVIVARVNRAAEAARIRTHKIAWLKLLMQEHGPDSEWASLLADTLRS